VGYPAFPKGEDNAKPGSACYPALEIPKPVTFISKVLVGRFRFPLGSIRSILRLPLFVACLGTLNKASIPRSKFSSAFRPLDVFRFLHMDYVTRQFINLTKKFRKELRKYHEALHHDLSRLADGLKNLKDTESEHKKATETGNDAPPVTKAELSTQVPISVKTYPQRSGKEIIWGVTKGILEIAVGIAVVGYTAVTFQIWQETIDATNSSARQTELARKGLNEAVKHFLVDQRPWVTVTFVPGLNFPVNPLGLANSPFTITNIGKTLALEVRIEAATVVVDAVDKKIPFDDYKGMPITIGVLFPNMPKNYGTPVVMKLKNGGRGGVKWDEVIPGVRDQKKYILGYVSVWYHDAFGKSTHVTKFCQLLEGDFIGKKYATTLSPPSPIKKCEAYNRAYDE
jgi:hypothetical protein